MVAVPSVDELYAQQLRPLPLAARLRLIELLARDLAAEQQPSELSLLELAGLGAEIWQGIDAQAYVNELRDEWDRPR